MFGSSPETEETNAENANGSNTGQWIKKLISMGTITVHVADGPTVHVKHTYAFLDAQTGKIRIENGRLFLERVNMVAEPEEEVIVAEAEVISESREAPEEPADSVEPLRVSLEVTPTEPSQESAELEGPSGEDPQRGTPMIDYNTAQQFTLPEPGDLTQVGPQPAEPVELEGPSGEDPQRGTPMIDFNTGQQFTLPEPMNGWDVGEGEVERYLGNLENPVLDVI